MRIALAPGIACYEAGEEYAHGGLSPQECVIPVLTVTVAAAPSQPVTIGQVRWVGLRCRVQLIGTSAGFAVDLRTKPNDPTSTLIGGPKGPNATGLASFAVADDRLAGTVAIVVVLDSDGDALVQEHTTIGEDEE